MRVGRFVWRVVTAWALAASALGACSPAARKPPLSGQMPIEASPAVQITAPVDSALPTVPPPPGVQPLVVFCAGSLILPFAEIEAAFEAANPQYDVLNECHGSIQVIRHVTELHERIDVVATADHALIPMLMFAARNPDSGRAYAEWSVRFAGNRLSLAYTPQSRAAGEIDAHNWYEVIAQPGVRLGLPDPRFDAAGYRALMALKLAERHYARPGIFNDLIRDAFRYPISAFTEDGFTEISVPEIVEPRPDAGIVVRGASIQLIALLESGDLDYAFEYESVIRQHGLEWVDLPAAVNLGEASAAGDYGRVQVKLDFQRFASVEPVFRGEPIGYGVTIPTNAPNPEGARRYLGFLLGAEGRAIMAGNFQPLLEPLRCVNVEQAPAEVAALCGHGP